MIARIWHGRTPAEKADDYLEYVERVLLSFLWIQVSLERPMDAAEATENSPGSRAYERPRVARVSQQSF